MPSHRQRLHQRPGFHGHVVGDVVERCDGTDDGGGEAAAPAGETHEPVLLAAVVRVGEAGWAGPAPYDGLQNWSVSVCSRDTRPSLIPRADELGTSAAPLRLGGFNSLGVLFQSTRTSTATRSPSLKSFTPAPTSVTIALNSCPNVSGTVSPVMGCGVVGHRFGPPMYSWRSGGGLGC